MKQLISCVLFLFLLANCSGGGEEPNVKFSGVKPEAAIKLVAEDKPEDKFESTIEYIRNNRRQGFDWSVFWQGLADNQVLESKTAEQRMLIAQLSDLDCSFKAYNSFLSLVSPYPEFDKLIMTADRACEQDLTEANFSALFNRLAKESVENLNSESAVYFSFLISEMEVEEQPELIRSLMDGYTERKWVEAAKQWLQFENPVVIQRFVKAQRTAYGSSKVLETLAIDAFFSPTPVGETLQTIGLTFGLDLLAQARVFESNDERITPELLKAQMQSLATEFAKLEPQVDQTNFEHVIEQARTFERFLTLMARAFPSMEPIEALQIIDQTIFHFETLVPSDREAIRLSLDMPDDLSIAVALMRNYSSEVGRRYFENVLEQNDTFTELGALLKLRIELHLTENTEAAALMVGEFCEHLEELEVSKTTLQQIENTAFETPGCFEIKPEDPLAEIEVQLSSVTSSFFNVFSSNGASLNIAAEVFRGNIIDTSSTFEHPDLP
ncbi:MAG: hypothetical protein HRT45_19695, partial [Bdellovibrionales bacterium]|nr:hypothetical protein [Bdellovibrionales bacterium]